MKGINEVKKDLRELKKHAHAIERLKNVQKTHMARIKMLEKMTPNDKVSELIKKEMEHLNALPICNEIEKARKIEEKYMNAIMELDPVEKSIIVDTYINGVPYWKIGLELGYSEEGIRKRISKAIKSIACQVNVPTI